MSHRLEENTRTISWTETRQITIGYHDCGVCGVETPEPSMEQMIEFAKEGREFMWPDRSVPGCTPAGGWSHDDNEGDICPSCTEAKREVFASRRKVGQADQSA